MMDAHQKDEIVNGKLIHEQAIRDEIAFLEQRLTDITAADDSAYEKLLAKAYDHLLLERRSQLEKLLTD